MNTIHECEVIQGLDTGLCPHCRRYKKVFEVLVPRWDSLDEIVEACRPCIKTIIDDRSYVSH